MERITFITVLLLSLSSLGLCQNCNFTKPCNLDPVKDLNGSVCTRISFNVEINIEYFNASNKTVTASVCLPCTNVTVIGSCDQTENLLQLDWNNGTNSYGLMMTFTKNSKKGSQHWTMNNITVDVDADYFNSTVNFTANATTDFVGNLDYTRSYQCKHSQKIKLGVPTVGNTTINASLTLANFRVQSFEFKNFTSGEFGNAYKCTLDASASKIVPIAVGAALGGLIIVVLVAYVIGRLRSRKQSTYEPLS